ncbi:MAG: menaquinone biosynthesis protein [Bacteroidetes bacterium]|nr:menaquinone biosynthesis protein [Bacteroidota bacterium]
MADKKIKVSVVSYTNSLPFVYGLENYPGEKKFELQKDIPAVCAQKLLTNKVDVGLVPVAILPQLEEYHIISDYCIGADGAVGSVLLFSDVPLREIRTILLDFHSRTSVQLVQLLSEKFWKIAPVWKNATEDFIADISGTTAAVVIGDRTFSLKNTYKYSYDLSEEWKNFTGLSFVFAAWVANKKLPDVFLSSFEAAVRYGIDNKAKVIEQLKLQAIPGLDAAHYLNTNIQFDLDEGKKKGLELFLSYLKREI